MAIKSYARVTRGINTLLNYLGNDRECRHRVIWIRTHIIKVHIISNDIDVFNDSEYIGGKSRFILRPTANANNVYYYIVGMKCEVRKNGTFRFFAGELQKGKMCNI